MKNVQEFLSELDKSGPARMSSEAWCEVLGARVIDPDGWDRANYDVSWSEPITKEEFERRFSSSTIDSSGWMPDNYYTGTPLDKMSQYYQD